jgi:AcrR family transcriptional regulator
VVPAGREQRKQRTRAQLMEAALGLLRAKSFTSLSLREVTRAAGVVPTAFYRHFDSMDELGLALVEDSFRTLREMIRSARADAASFEHVIRDSVEIVVRQVRSNPDQFRFVVRERHGGSPVLRDAIRAEIRLFGSELATDLSRFPHLSGWNTEDLQMMAGLIVNAMVSTAEAIVDAPPDSPRAEEDAIQAAEHQLLLIALGVPHFRSQ